MLSFETDSNWGRRRQDCLTQTGLRWKLNSLANHSTHFFLLEINQGGENLGSLGVLSIIFSSKQCLRPLGNCAPFPLPSTRLGPRFYTTKTFSSSIEASRDDVTDEQLDQLMVEKKATNWPTLERKKTRKLISGGGKNNFPPPGEKNSGDQKNPSKTFFFWVPLMGIFSRHLCI